MSMKILNRTRSNIKHVLAKRVRINNVLTTTITLYACYTCDVQIRRFLVNTKKQTFHHNFVVSRVTFRLLFGHCLYVYKHIRINGHVDYIILIIIVCAHQKRAVIVSLTRCLIRLMSRISGAYCTIVWCANNNKILLYSRLSIPE